MTARWAASQGLRIRSLGVILGTVLAGALTGISGCSSQEDLSGLWVGEMVLAEEGPLRSASVELELREENHHLSGRLVARNQNPPPGTVASRTLEIREGLAAEGRLFFTATAPVAAGRARLTFSGSVRGDLLEGEVEADVSTTEGGALLHGRLTARRRSGP